RRDRAATRFSHAARGVAAGGRLARAGVSSPAGAQNRSLGVACGTFSLVSSALSADGARRPVAFTRANAVDFTRGRPAAFLDRDGVLNEGVPDPDSRGLESPLLPQDVRLLPGAAASAARLAKAGYGLVCVSNQP